MDADVEMVGRDNRFSSQGVVAASEYEMPISRHVHMRRQNRCFGCALGAVLMSAIVFVLARIYGAPEQQPIAETVYEPDSGSTEDSESPVIGAGQSDYIPPPLKHEDFANWLQNRTHEEPIRPVPGDVLHNGTKVRHYDSTGWENATVTLDDGIMYQVIAKLGHDTKAFTEGLTFGDGVLYESTGLNGRSSIQILSPSSGAVQESYPMDSMYFGEGLAFVKGKLVQLTYRRKTGFVYDTKNLSVPEKTFMFDTTTGEGWGLTFDPYRNELIVSDGSDYLHFWDPDTFKEIRKIKVTRQQGKDSSNINELEFWRGRVLANVWYQDVIISIDPESGVVDKEYAVA